MRKCPECPAARICSRCDLCAACIPADVKRDTAAAAQQRRQQQQQQQQPQPQPQQRSQQQPQSQPQQRPRPSGGGHDPDAPMQFSRKTPFGAPVGPGTPEVWTRSAEASAPPPPAARQKGRGNGTYDSSSEDEDDVNLMEADDDTFDRMAAPEKKDLLGILLAMGFQEKDARAALEKNTTTATAIGWLMTQGVGLHGALCRAGSGMYDAAKPAADNLFDVAKPAADGVVSATSGLFDIMTGWGEQVHSWVRSSSLSGPSGGPAALEGGSGAASEIEETLLALGFARREAAAASRRCSSVEAAVDWIAANPGLAATAGGAA
mmetsp:Transcript_170484/g.546787  ORF Transcript_170484/g.546787 Transcript_170484/m.546787 type:complete len:320 (+) Transcript_170484:640-1599(+)